MKTLIHDDKKYQAEKIIKTDTDIVGYTGEKIEFAFRGIKDFSLFRLADGQEWDLPEQLQQDLEIAEAYESLYNEILANSLALAEIYEMIVWG